MLNKVKVERHIHTNWRIVFFVPIFLLMFLILLGSLAYRQLFSYDTFMQKSDMQILRRIIKPGARGDILDREGNVLVSNRPRFSVVVYFNEIRLEFRRKFIELKKEAKEIPNSPLAKMKLDDFIIHTRKVVLEEYMAKINNILGTNYQLNVKEFSKHFTEKMFLPYPIIEDLTDEQYTILAEKLPVDSPVQVYCDSVRSYPNGSVAAHILGYIRKEDKADTTGIDGEDLRTYFFEGKVGRTGVERFFDETLKGVNGMQIWVVDPQGFQYDLVQEISPKKGQSLSLSLDLDMQKTAEKAFGTRRGALVAMDIYTGEVLAMVSKPDYDLNDLSPSIPPSVFNEIEKNGAWLNRAMQASYPPGSTFKLVSTIAAMRAETLDPHECVNCKGFVMVGNRKFPCNSRWGHGEVDLEKAISKSCNVYFYEKGEEASIEFISDTARIFGLDEKTEVNLPFENAKVLVPDRQYKKDNFLGSWTMGDTANTSIGQGYLLQTPLQMACFISSLARKETRTKPSITREILGATDATYHNAKPLPISDENYKVIVEAMKKTVTEGTGKSARSDIVEIAAKTGTAQFKVAGKPVNLAWIVAFAPADKPEIAMAVMVEGDSVGDVSGGLTTGPIAKEVFESYFIKKPKATWK